jgi:hypothetical protein
MGGPGLEVEAKPSDGLEASTPSLPWRSLYEAACVGDHGL